MSDKNKRRFWNNWSEVKESTMTPEKLREYLYKEAKDKFTKEVEAQYQQFYDAKIDKDIPKIRAELTESLTKSITESVTIKMKQENEAKPLVERDYKYSMILYFTNGKEILIRYNHSDTLEGRFRFYGTLDKKDHIASVPIANILYFVSEKQKDLVTTPVKKTATSRKKAGE